MKRLILSILALALFFSASAQRKNSKSEIPGQQRFEEVWGLINEKYVEDPDMNNLSEKAIAAMLKTLDPHSMYISAKDVAKANENLQGNFEGVGISFQVLDDTINVVEVIEGGPSERAGVEAGDKIIAIDGISAVGDSANAKFVSSHLRGPKGSTVTVSLVRKGQNISVSITRDKVPIFSIDTYFMASDTVGYIRLARFARTSAVEFRNALNQLEKKGLRSLILDLRGNSGGFLDIATSLANEFLESSRLIVYTDGRAFRRQNFKTNLHGGFRKGRLVVLIDENSASASEILSGAIQDWERGTIVGRRSFGKGLVQKLFTLKDGGQVRLTTARYYTPSGRCIQKPYDGGTDDYQKDLANRYKHGELVNMDSIHFPDSLKFRTMITGRTVYGGGGIMPDIFVPMDTVKLTDYYLAMRDKSVLSEFPLRWVNARRDELKNVSFEDFVLRYEDYKVDAELASYAEGKGIVRDTALETTMPDRVAHTERYLHYLMEAMIVQKLYGNPYYFRVMKDIDDCYQRALKEF